MPAELQRTKCVHHPERYGHAVCMSCGKTLCQECATTWDGINYCSACLGKRRRAEREGASVLSWGVLMTAVVLLFFGLRQAMVWGAGLLALWMG